MTVIRTACTACAGLPQRQAQHCHECKGVRFIERIEVPKTCTGKQPECPIEFDPMCGGWECSRCGRSGPL
jgi:hypothetical protein